MIPEHKKAAGIIKKPAALTFNYFYCANAAFKLVSITSRNSSV